ncbi:MAG: hypothetical protein ACI89J_002753, partial [Hyphomicrobiaceae bacterium]
RSDSNVIPLKPDLVYSMLRFNGFTMRLKTPNLRAI